MASTLPTNIAVSTTGHPGLHNAVNAAVNEHDGRIASLEGRATALEGVAQIVGAGRPDIPASMTTAVQAQVAAAPVGSTFSSTDGASVGAWQWQKRPAGWQIVALDTGWRALTPTGSNVSAFTTLAIRRVNQLVRLRVAGLVLTGTGIFVPAVTGFSPGAYMRFPLLTSGSTTSWTGTLVVTPTGGLQSTAAFSTTGDTLEMSWATTDAAPTTLPGTATS